MPLINVAYTKKNVDGTFTEPVELKFAEFDEMECFKHLGISHLHEMDSCKVHELSHFKMVSIELAQKASWTYERHMFIVAK